MSATAPSAGQVDGAVIPAWESMNMYALQDTGYAACGMAAFHPSLPPSSSREREVNPWTRNVPPGPAHHPFPSLPKPPPPPPFPPLTCPSVAATAAAIAAPGTKTAAAAAAAAAESVGVA